MSACTFDCAAWLAGRKSKGISGLSVKPRQQPDSAQPANPPGPAVPQASALTACPRMARAAQESEAVTSTIGGSPLDQSMPY